MRDGPASATDRPTEVAEFAAGPVEYRWERHGDETMLVFHGGHLRAGIALGEDVYTSNGYSVLVPSRPGYGRTPVSTGRTPDGFADATAKLCAELGIGQVAAVVGISAGGRTAVATAARHPRLVPRLVLESAVGFLPYPDPRTRMAAYVGFNPYVERATWAAVRLLMRHLPKTGLRLMLNELSSMRGRDAIDDLDEDARSALLVLFGRMRSGHGFLNDVRTLRTVEPVSVSQPALVVASRRDGGVPIAHAESLLAHIPRAELVVSTAVSHMIWASSDYPTVAERIQTFIAAD